MLKIRLRREGKKKNPCYKIVVINTLTKRDGKIIKNIGYYNPLTKFGYIKKALLIKYLNFGAYPTSTVRYLIKTLIFSETSNIY